MNNTKEQTGKEGKSADKEQMLYDCKKKIANLHGFSTWTDLMVTYFSATAYGKISIAFEEVCEMYSQQRIAEELIQFKNLLINIQTITVNDDFNYHKEIYEMIEDHYKSLNR